LLFLLLLLLLLLLCSGHQQYQAQSTQILYVQSVIKQLSAALFGVHHAAVSVQLQ
jgi:hypothetical protein